MRDFDFTQYSIADDEAVRPRCESYTRRRATVVGKRERGMRRLKRFRMCL